MKPPARLAARERRKAIPPGVRAEKSRRIRDATLALPEVRAARSVVCYASVHSEVETGELAAALRAAGKRVFAPEDSFSEADVILTPALAFSESLERLGQGAGFFDRLFARLPDAVRVGLAFEEQIVLAVPTEPHDVRMHVVVTDRRVLRPA